MRLFLPVPFVIVPLSRHRESCFFCLFWSAAIPSPLCLVCLVTGRRASEGRRQKDRAAKESPHYRTDRKNTTHVTTLLHRTAHLVQCIGTLDESNLMAEATFHD